MTMNPSQPSYQNQTINYQVILDFLGTMIVDDKNIQFLTNDESKLEFVQKFLQHKSQN